VAEVRRSRPAFQQWHSFRSTALTKTKLRLLATPVTALPSPLSSSLLFAQDLAERRGNLPGIWRGCRDLVEKRPGERSQVVIKELLLEPPRRARASAPRQRTRHNDHQPVRRSCACPRTTPQPRGLPSEGAVTRALALAFAESAERGDLGELSSRIRAAQVSVVDPYLDGERCHDH
jgi:hypothetical protein